MCIRDRAIDSITVGIGHADNGDSGRAEGADVSGTTLGATYEQGAWGFGTSYNTAELDAAASRNQDAWSVGTAYTFAPEINGATPLEAVIAADLTFFDRDASNNGATAEDDGSQPSEEYQIKGKVSSKIYHPPESPFFSRTKADVWFTTSEVAEKAGFSLPSSMQDSNEDDEPSSKNENEETGEDTETEEGE